MRLEWDASRALMEAYMTKKYMTKKYRKAKNMKREGAAARKCVERFQGDKLNGSARSHLFQQAEINVEKAKGQKHRLKGTSSRSLTF